MQHTFAISVLDGEGDDDKRTARMLATITNAINNALRLSGKDVPQEHYRTEESFMPTRKRRHPPRQQKSWSDVVRAFGW